MISRGEAYPMGVGANYFDWLDGERTVRCLVNKLHTLDLEVQIQLYELAAYANQVLFDEQLLSAARGSENRDDLDYLSSCVHFLAEARRQSGQP